jgi:hypothetical protein
LSSTGRVEEAFVHYQRAAELDPGNPTISGDWSADLKMTRHVREVGGLVGVAYRSRRPDEWTRRTTPPSSNGTPAPMRGGEGTMGSLWNELRGATRTLARRPGLVVLAGLTLSLGIGASTAMFSVVQSVLIRPLPVPAPEELVAVYPGWPAMRGHPTMGGLKVHERAMSLYRDGYLEEEAKHAKRSAHLAPA